jgi:uncharacterized protein YprB with RNaseH-like and TPR domain
MLGPSLRERLGELSRRRRAEDRDEPAPRRSPLATERTAIGVEEYLPGGEWRDEAGAVYVHERLRSAIEQPLPHWGSLGEAPEDEVELSSLVSLGLGRALFLDLETGGFASSPVFLAGTMHWNGTDYVLRQYFARHYGEEAALVRALDESARGFEFLVTFNGKSYDAPFLTSRAMVHGVRLALPPRHLDLLHPSRRRWREELPDCRLQTLERYVCRRRRSGDVPSDEVPALYHDYVRRGDPYRLIPVFHHNMLDVITMVEILRALCSPDPRRRQPELPAFRARADTEMARAAEAIWLALELGDPGPEMD